MKIEELEELYKDALQEGGKFDNLAERITDELTPKQIIKLARSDMKSLYWNPDGNELPSIELIRDYFYNYLKDMGDYLTDPSLKVNPNEN